MAINGKLICTILVISVAVFSENAHPFQTVSKGKDVQEPPSPVEESHNITLFLANRMHLALVARMMLKVPDEIDLELRYCGLLASDIGGKRGQRVHGSIGVPTLWRVQVKDGSPVFDILVSTKRTPGTHYVCKMEKEHLFISVAFIQDVGVDPSVEEIKKKRVEIGNRSVHDMLVLLEGPAADIETQFEP